MPDEYKPVPFKTLAGVLDVRSAPEQQAPGSVRFRQNFSVSGTGRMCRRYGWEKLLTGPVNYNNADLHDQLLPLQFYYDDFVPQSEGAAAVRAYPSGLCRDELKTRAQGREHITLLFEAISTSGSRTLLAATQSRIYELNEAIGNWRLLADGLGGPYSSDLGVRFRAAQVRDDIVFTNNYDDVFIYTLGNEITGCAMRATHSISDLSLIRLAKAHDVVSFKGMIVLMNVVMDGGRIENRIVWSDLNDAKGFDPADPNSITGYKDLSYGHRILTAKVLGDSLFVYTNRGIWVGITTGNPDEAITFSLLYSSEEGARCLAYRNTLISTGDAHYYAGTDGIYKIDKFSVKPERIEWIHRGSGVIFSDINTECCESHNAGYSVNPDKLDSEKEKEIWISWAPRGSCIPSRTLVIQPENKFVDTVDHGFTTFLTYQPDRRLSAKDFFREICACTGDELDGEYMKEAVPVPVPACPNPPTMILTEDTIMTDDVETEDWNATTINENSLCAILTGRRLDDFCLECKTEQLFIGASVRDRCLKQIGTALSREVCYNAEVGTGSLNGFRYTASQGIYGYEGYYSIIRIGPLNLGNDSVEKTINRVMLGMEAEPELAHNIIAIRVGSSYSPLDPNDTDHCSILWGKYQRRLLVCPQRSSPAEYAARNTRPSIGAEWPQYVTARYFYLEVLIAGLQNQNDIDSVLVAPTGGASCFSSVTFKARRA